MSYGIFKKVSCKKAEEVCSLYRLSTGARKLLRPDMTPAQFVETLIEAGQYVDAYDFLAHALPKREAIWWACLSVRHALGAALPPKQFAALKAAVEWVLEPDEPKRRAAQAAGEAADFATPAGCAALAVYGSGGSLGLAIYPDVPPSPTMTAQAVAGCITMASVQGEPATIPDVQREIALLGIVIAEGNITWQISTKNPGRFPAAEPARGQRF
jgi:hypothetical protein